MTDAERWHLAGRIAKAMIEVARLASKLDAAQEAVLDELADRPTVPGGSPGDQRGD
jgi:hypothetical protein